METLIGKAASPGIAIGSLLWAAHETISVEKRTVSDPEAEVQRFVDAQSKALLLLSELGEKAKVTLGEENALLFEIHQMMLTDGDFEDSIRSIIRTNQVCAEYAVNQTAENFAAAFSAMDDDYMKARAADVKDISKRLLEILSGQEDTEITSEAPCIYAAEDFTPSETARFARGRVLAMITEAGAKTGHTAIFARTMDLPAVMGLGPGLSRLNGRTVIVDGTAGLVLVDPDREKLVEYETLLNQARADKARQAKLFGAPAITKDGQRIALCANIGSVEDTELALAGDAEGIGLFRSEFLYLQAANYPSEETQFAAYRAVCEKLAPRRVIIRTLDIGADKQADYFGLDKEENPALGYRAIRICLDRTDMFKTQLRALLRASVYGHLAIMLPMITAPWEVIAVRELLETAKAELACEGKPYDPSIELGIMIETPAAVMVSDKLAKVADFFSVGTNDLTQYVLSIDRQNSKLNRYLDPHHLGLLRMLRCAADCIHKAGKWIGICGELAADPDLTELFLAMGIDELSMPPARILPLKERIRSLDLSSGKEALLNALDWED